MITPDKKILIVQSLLTLYAVAAIICAVYYSVKRRKYPVLVKVSLSIAALGVLSAIDMYLVEPHWINVEHVKIYDNELARDLVGIKVVQISDLHVSTVGFRERQMIKKINELKPDILLITGDFFSQGRGMEAAYEFEEVTEIIKNIKTTHGSFGVFGNYDGYLRRHPDRVKELRKSGLNMLDDESITIKFQNKRSITIVGTEFSFGEYYSDNKFAQSVRNIPAHSPVILMNHYPDVFSKAHEAGINLVLAGHTHGGQIGIPWLYSHSNSANKSTFMHGLFDSGKTKMYVNQGIGTGYLPIRLFCRPEITVFDFVAEAVR